MCINEDDLKCTPRDSLTKRQRNLCNDELAINRDIVCCALASSKSNFSKPIKCLEGLGVCGIYGMLWEKIFKDEVDVTINGIQKEDHCLISKNLNKNELKGKAINEDPCIHLRTNCYDFVFLNCGTNATKYFDSVFSNIGENAILIITTSEDASLYWQAPELALRNYNGVIAKTSYHREVAVRLVIAEMARTCAKYNKGLKILCTIGYKPQQSFTIIANIKKGIPEANKSMQNILKLAHCNMCEDRKFIPNSCFIDKLSCNLSCDCSKNAEGKIIMGLGPLWAGEIFDVDFIESMIQQSKGFPWGNRVSTLLSLILQEARCSGKASPEPPLPKKAKQEMKSLTDTIPYFYFNTHRHSPKEFKLQKISKIVSLLQSTGYRASRTHFDSEAIRTNAPLSECVKILRTNS